MLKLMFSMFQDMAVSTETPKKLETLNIEGVVDYLNTCKNVICMIGAGISTCK
jgi:hypothetical protein